MLILAFIILIGIIIADRLACSSYDLGIMTFLSSMTLILLTCGTLAVGMMQAEDLGTLVAQDQVIAVYEDNIQDLSARLNELKPTQQQAIFNADTPVGSLIASISASNNALVEAKATKAKAYVSIAQRQRGPFWFVTKFYN